MNSYFETVRSSSIQSWLVWTALNILSYPFCIWVILVEHVLALSITFIFSFILNKAKLEIIIHSLSIFEFDVQNVLLPRIENRVNKYFIPATIILLLLDLINKIINLLYFQILRSTISGFYQINFWWDWLLKKIYATEAFNHFLSNLFRFVYREILYSLILVDKILDYLSVFFSFTPFFFYEVIKIFLSTFFLRNYQLF